jgi:hypothetical protein
MGQIAPDVFVIADLGPRQVGGSAGTPMRRLSQRIRRLCDGAPSLCEGHVRIAELAFASDDGTPAKFLLTELDKRPSSCLPISDVPPSPAATTAGEPARRLRLPPGPTGGFASASVIPLPGTAMRVAVPVEG